MRWCSVALALVAACGTDVDPACRTSETYQTVGGPFIENWCRGCHSIDLPIGQRQRAPGDVNFDTIDEIRAQAPAIERVITAGTMPPAGGPSDDERTMMMQWLRCGAP